MKKIFLLLTLAMFAGICHASGHVPEKDIREHQHHHASAGRHQRKMSSGKEKQKKMHPSMRRYFDKLRSENPAEYERLQKLRRDDRKAFMEEMFRRFPPQRDENSERLHEIEKRCWEFSAQLRNTNDEDKKAELQAELRKNLEESCDVMLAMTRKHMEKLQKKIEHIEKNRSTILEQRYKFFTEPPPPPTAGKE